MATELADTNVVKLQEMDRAESLEMLRRSLLREEGLLDDELVVKDLLQELTHLPLAIAQAAAYLNNNGLSISDYLKLMRRTERDMISLMDSGFRDSSTGSDSEKAIATTWLVSFEQIRHSDPNAAVLLVFMSHIEPKAIPHSMLPALRYEADMVSAIGTLYAYAYISKRGPSQVESQVYDMHRLVHLATRIWIQHQGMVPNSSIDPIEHVADIFP